MTLPLARELAEYKIRVNAIAPGAMDTPMTDGLRTEEVSSMRSGRFLFAFASCIRFQELEALRSAIPNPSRMGDPKEFAKLVKHLIKNPYINGEVIRLDGALRLPHVPKPQH